MQPDSYIQVFKQLGTTVGQLAEGAGAEAETAEEYADAEDGDKPEE